ncbi:MAG: hypothetical protein LBP26_00815 [Clostridiales bacterium]|jgi:hypothetical protein|nr:hypothetical protein [Clostridiales bacterium]
MKFASVTKTGSFAHKKSTALTALAVVAAVIATFVLWGMLSDKTAPVVPPEIPAGMKIVTSAPKPDDGSAPSDYDAKQNFYIAAGVINDAPYFSSSTAGTVTAKVALIAYKQNVSGLRVKKDSAVFHEALSSSALKSVAVQKFVSGNVRLNRVGAVKKDSVSWGAVTELTERGFNSLYGIAPFEICNYAVSDDTVTDYGVADGEYYLVLNPAKAAEYYKYEMRNMGGASDYPEFSSIRLSFTIDENWVVQTLKVRESYKIAIGGLGDAACDAVITQTFTGVGDSSGTLPAAADDFLKYVPAGAADDAPPEAPKSAADYLAEAFAPFLSGGPVNLTADVAAAGISAKIEASVDLNRNEFKFRVGDGLTLVTDTQRIWFDLYGKKGYVTVEKALAALGELGLQIDTSALEALAADDLTAALFENCELTESGGKVHILMPFTLFDVGFNVDIALVKDGGSYKADGISAVIDIAGTQISADLKFTDSVTFPTVDDIKANESFANFDVLFDFIEPVKTLAAAKYFELDFDATVANVTATGSAAVNLTNGGADVRANVSLLGHNALVHYADNLAYVTLNGKLMLSLDPASVPDILERIGKAIPGAVPESVTSFALPDINALIPSFDLQTAIGLIGGLINGVSVTDSSVSLEYVIDGVTLVFTLYTPEDGKLKARLAFNYANGDNPVDGTINITLKNVSADNTPITVPDKDKYVAVEKLAEFIEPAIDTVNQKAFHLTFEGAIEGGENDKLAVAGYLKVATLTSITEASFPELDLKLSIGKDLALPEHSLRLLTAKDGSGALVCHVNYNGLKIKLGYTEALKIVGAVSDILGLRIPALDALTSGVYDPSELDTAIFKTANFAGLTDSIKSVNDLFAVGGGFSAEEILGGVIDGALKNLSVALDGDDTLVIDYDGAKIILQKGEKYLSRLTVRDVKLDGKTAGFTLTLNVPDSAGDFIPDPATESDFGGEMDFNSIYDLLCTLVNTANLREFEIGGDIEFLASKMPLDLKVSVDENGKTLVGMKLSLAFSIASAFVIDPFESYLYFDGDKLYLEKDTVGLISKKYTVERIAVTQEEFLANFTDYLLFLIPFKSYVKDAILNTETPAGEGGGTIQPSDILKAYSYDGAWRLTLDLKPLAGDMVGIMNVGLDDTEIDGKRYLHKISADLKLMSLFDMTLTATLKNTDGGKISPIGNVQLGYSGANTRYASKPIAEVFSHLATFQWGTSINDIKYIPFEKKA